MTEKATVVVLHGWGMSSFVTRYWCRQLRLAEFEPAEFAYHSLTRTLDANVDRLADHIRALPTKQSVHLVGHSLGGIIIMQCLANHRFDNLGRVVMVNEPDSVLRKRRNYQKSYAIDYLDGDQIADGRSAVYNYGTTT